MIEGSNGGEVRVLNNHKASSTSQHLPETPLIGQGTSWQLGTHFDVQVVIVS
jgi:hypothetical protein